MSCSVSNSFEAENEAEINNTSVSSMNATFELSAQDISLVSYISSDDSFVGLLFHDTVSDNATRGSVES